MGKYNYIKLGQVNTKLCWPTRQVDFKWGKVGVISLGTKLPSIYYSLLTVTLFTDKISNIIRTTNKIIIIFIIATGIYIRLVFRIKVNVTVTFNFCNL